MERDGFVDTGVLTDGTDNSVAGASSVSDDWNSEALVQALTYLEAEFARIAPSIDVINVFPVADGDTGTNMLATIRAAKASAAATKHRCTIDEPVPTVRAVLIAAAEGAVDGARGNSGAILSQFFAGFATTPTAGSELDAVALMRRLRAGTRAARAAVARPENGTILTVMEAAASCVPPGDESGLTLEEALDATYQRASKALAGTTAQLSVLAEAGVVDAGGCGFVALLGTLLAFEVSRRGHHPAAGVPDLLEALLLPKCQRATPGRSTTFVRGIGAPTYCINFVLDGHECAADDLRDRLNCLGDSLIVVEGTGRLRVHLHSPDIEGVMAEANTIGAVDRLQIDEIMERVAFGQAANGRQALSAVARSDQDRRSIRVLACASGDGLEQVLRVMGATIVPRSDLPGFDEMLRSAIETLASTGDEVVLLPNDAALIAPIHALVEERDSMCLHLIETRSIPQGLAALTARHPRGETKQSVELMRAASLQVKTLVVVNALHTLDGGQAGADGAYLGRIDGRAAVRGDDPAAVLIDMLMSVEPEDYELLTVFSGLGVETAMLEYVKQAVSERFPGLAIEILDGGQSGQAFIAALE